MTAPSTFNEAKKSKEWCKAWMTSLSLYLDTWSICSLPEGKMTLGSRWLFKLKLNADGSVERPKGSLVAKGYTQQEGVDFFDTLSPVAKMVTVKMLFALAAKKKWFLHQLDISNTFLNGDLSKEIYMDIPPGYAEIKGVNLPHNAVLELKKSIYGLKQASRQWFLKFSSTLLRMGFEKINVDHTLFWSHSADKFLMVLDILIASNSETSVSSLITQRSSCFKLRDIGNQDTLELKLLALLLGFLYVNTSIHLTFLLMLDCLIVVLHLFQWISASSFSLKMMNSFLTLKLIDV